MSSLDLELETVSTPVKLTSSEKKKAKRARQKQKARTLVKTEHGYMYIGHLPHGFYEEGVQSYFSQFGRIVQLRLARSRKTGMHKGYGFIEFESKEVATIAAETMNNYLMFNKILKCHLIPKEKLSEMTFKNAKKTFHVPLKTALRKRFNRTRSEEELQTLKAKQEKKMNKKMAKLKELGIDLDLSKLNSVFQFK